MKIGKIRGFRAPRIHCDDGHVLWITLLPLFDSFKKPPGGSRRCCYRQAAGKRPRQYRHTLPEGRRSPARSCNRATADAMHRRELVSKLLVPRNPFASLLAT